MELKKYINPGLKVLSVILILLGSWVVVDHYLSLSPEETGTSGLTKITAIIKDKKATEPAKDDPASAPDTVYEVVLEYHFGGTQRFYKTRAVDKEYYDRVFIGDSIPVYADNKNPYHVVLPDSRSSTHDFFNRRFFLGILMILAGGALWFFASKRKPAAV